MVEAAADRTPRPNYLQSYASTSLVNFFYSYDINIQLLVSIICLRILSELQFVIQVNFYLLLQIGDPLSPLSASRSKR